MATLTKRDETTKREDERAGQLDIFDRFDRLFGDWMSALPFRRPMERWTETREQMIRVEEFEENGNLVVRAELPGVDPDKDVEVTVQGRNLRITAERREEEKKEERGYVCNELRYGKFVRTLALPEGVAEGDIKATYQNGILEVRLPVTEAKPATKVPVTQG
jgi:HSP20 family protein